MDLVHAILYRIARTVEYGLNITSADFMGKTDDPHFTKSHSRWDSFAQAVGSGLKLLLLLFLLISSSFLFLSHVLMSCGVFS